MARPRKISPDDILDATERVILRLGAVGVSIDAVAKEAGVSKSRVVYDHKSKNALLRALLERYRAQDQALLEEAVRDQADSPHPELFGRIALAERAPDEVERAVFMAISAAMPTEAEIHETIKEWIRKDMEAMRLSDRPQAARHAYLALNGFYWNEFSGFHQWTDAERREILDDIRRAFLAFPEPPHPEAPPSSISLKDAADGEQEG